MVRRVQQDDEEGCGIACVAMFTGNTYKQMKKYFVENILKKQERLHTRNYQVRDVLRRYGIHTVNRVFKKWHGIKTNAIVPINRRRGGGWHWVVFIHDHENPYIIDPYFGKSRRKYDFRGVRARGFYIAICD